MATEILAGSTATGPASATWLIDGRPCLNFAGAGYLALGALPELRDAARAVLDSGAAFTRQLSPAYGVADEIFDAVEAAAAAAFGTPAAVYFASGYLIGMAALAVVCEQGDHLFVDAGAHYNLVAAARATGLPTEFFAHRRPDALAELLPARLAAGGRPLVVTDGTAATTGELAPLREYADVIEPYGGVIVVDDAHGFGVVGEHGRGAAEHLGVEQVAVVGATLSKAYCAQGAVVGCASREAAKRAESVPPLRGANSGSTISAAVGAAALSFVSSHPERRRHVQDLAAHLRRGLRSLGLTPTESPAPIVAFRVGDGAEMRAVQRRLFDAGIYVPISNYLGAGPDGIFRCAVFADHTVADLDTLLAAVGRVSP